mgnify:FL=1
MRKFIANSFSINMLPLLEMDILRIKKITTDMITADVESAIGHADTARIVSNILGFEVKPNRVSIKLTEEDILYVAQYTGPRLSEGATSLPEGASIEFLEVTFRKNGCSGCHGYDTGDCQNCKLSYWLSNCPIEKM